MNYFKEESLEATLWSFQLTISLRQRGGEGDERVNSEKLTQFKRSSKLTK